MARQWYESVGAGQQCRRRPDWLRWMPKQASRSGLQRLAPLGQGEQEKVQLAMQQAELAHAKRYDLSFRILSQALENWRSPA
jgi:hypothetical protein